MVKGPEIRDTRLTIRIPHSLRKAIEKEAAKQRRSVSDVAVLLLTDALSGAVQVRRSEAEKASLKAQERLLATELKLREHFDRAGIEVPPLRKQKP